MAYVTHLQKGIRLVGDTTSGSVTMRMPLSEIFDVGDWESAVFTINISELSLAASDTATFDLYTSPLPDPDANTIGERTTGVNVNAITTAGVGRWTFNPGDSSQALLQRYLWWEVVVNKVSAGGAFSMSFEIVACLKARSS